METFCGGSGGMTASYPPLSLPPPSPAAGPGVAAAGRPGLYPAQKGEARPCRAARDRHSDPPGGGAPTHRPPRPRDGFGFSGRPDPGPPRPTRMFWDIVGGHLSGFRSTHADPDRVTRSRLAFCLGFIRWWGAAPPPSDAGFGRRRRRVTPTDSHSVSHRLSLDPHPDLCASHTTDPSALFFRMRSPPLSPVIDTFFCSCSRSGVREADAFPDQPLPPNSLVPPDGPSAPGPRTCADSGTRRDGSEGQPRSPLASGGGGGYGLPIHPPPPDPPSQPRRGVQRAQRCVESTAFKSAHPCDSAMKENPPPSSDGGGGPTCTPPPSLAIPPWGRARRRRGEDHPRRSSTLKTQPHRIEKLAQEILRSYSQSR